MKARFFPILLVAEIAGTAVGQAASVTLENHQAFPISMPFCIRGLTLGEGSWTLDGRQAIQAYGTNAVFIAGIAAEERKKFQLKPGTIEGEAALVVQPSEAGVELVYLGHKLGTLSWETFLKPAPASPRPETQPPARENFSAAFQPLPLAFHKTSAGPVFETWTSEASQAGLKLKLELLAWREGFLDINARLVNESADERAKVYAAVVCRWEQAGVQERSMCYDNRITPLGGRAASPFRAGEGRHQYTQRGVDWVRNVFTGKVTAAWLNDFAPSFTLLDASSRNTFKQPRYEGASLPQLGQEAQTEGERFYSITEIARDNIRSYRDRLAENTLPARGEGVSFSSRIALGRHGWSNAEVDRMFVGFTSYNEQRRTDDGAAVSFGVPAVRFGTSYFPYSTLGENFDRWKLPGMDREAFWPLAADTVLRWREFADDIRRDLRIAKAMGFQIIRLHHLELLAPIPEAVRREYLDFLFGELRHLKLRVLLDIYASDAAVTELLKRYGDIVEGVELENEILIWGIPLDRPTQWKGTYAAIKRVAPQVLVHLTGYNNTGIFNRLESLGVPFDRVGLHSYVDSVDAIPTARGYALALGSFGSKSGKPPVITEWNWRQLTRMSPEARAKIYPAIFENALATRAIPEMHQFQFNETLAPNPRSGRGNVLRHYELIQLSRRPKLEALELMKLIAKYTPENDALRVIEISRAVVQLDAQGQGEAMVRIRNHGKRELSLRATLEMPEDFSAGGVGSRAVKLAPGETTSLAYKLKTRGATPGFYHGFVRLEGDGLLRYGWIETRLAAAPALDLAGGDTSLYPRGPAEELKLDFKRPGVVVYGKEASVLEVETAWAIAGTLESASGQPIEALQADDLAPGSHPGNVVLVGTPKSNELIASAGLAEAKSSIVTRVKSRGEQTWLAVSGPDPAAVEQAGMDLALRWWRKAKDSAARRVGLAEKELPRGGDATKLP